jgi:DNA repair protein RecN (Recombination protein N)
MLSSLTIKNYALIDDLHIDFNNGFSIITGETGAGKSIVLGALSLILGKRAELNNVKDANKKCIIEAVFDIANYNLKTLFKTENLDYEVQTIVRREILPSGKSRAFVNDSPVNLHSLQALGNSLLDIHSQHETLQLAQEAFQFQVIDALAKNDAFLKQYSQYLEIYKQQQKDLETLKNNQAEFTKELDYNLFLLKELEETKLNNVKLDDLEQTYEELNNIEEIKEKLSHVFKVLSDEQIGVLSTLKEAMEVLQKLSNISSKYEELSTRIASSYIEIDDIFSDIETAQGNLEDNPEALTEVNNKLQVLHNLLQKHTVNSIEELQNLEESLSKKVSITQNINDAILDKEQEIESTIIELNTLAKTISENRKAIIPNLIKQLERLLNNLGMPNAQFQINLSTTETYLLNGKDKLIFLFSANKGSDFKELKKVASGGELSRIMLCIKHILSKYVKLPTIIFDEIDTGVSGEISSQIANMLLAMSKNMQVFSITHSPQIAAKGDSHYRVYKEDVNNITQTNLIRLNEDERIVEIAQMLGGAKLSNSAIAHAKQLLN